jgi:glutamyl-tRNA synthetase
VTGWDDAVRGWIEFPNEKLEDVVIVRSDGRPTYNFASPVEDMDDRITHVIRGDDHVSNTPKQIQILSALGAELPVYAHVPDVLGDDGKKLSKRHGAQSVDEFREAGYLPEALTNFLALLGWSYDDHTTVMTPQELIERFSLGRVGSSPATFDYEKLEWLNGVHLRGLSDDEYGDRLVTYLRERGIDWPEDFVRKTVPLVKDKISTLGQYLTYAGFFFQDVDPPADVDGARPVLSAAADELATVEPFSAERIEETLRGIAERLELSPRKAFQPIRLAVTGSNVSPGLFESLELLGRDRSLARIRAAVA